MFFSSLCFCINNVIAFDGYGVCVSPHDESERILIPQVFNLLENAGVKWIRLGFRWDEIEYDKGKYLFDKNDALIKLASGHNFKVLGVLTKTPKWASPDKDLVSPPKDIEDWRKFVRETITRYKGQVNHWEIWNEPDIKKFWKGTDDEYINLLKAAYVVIKGIDPSIKVLSAGLDGNGEKYLDKLLGLNLASYCDIIAFHPYSNSPEKSLKRVKNLVSIMERHNVKKPIWLTEIGWQTGGWQEGPSIVKDEETKARYLEQAYKLLKPYAEAIFWYRAMEAPNMYGLIEIQKEGLKTLPAYNVYKEMTLVPIEATQ